MGKPLPPVPMAEVSELLQYAQRGLYGKSWYTVANAQINYVAQSEKWDLSELCGVIATTSPRCSVLRNIRLSLAFMNTRDLTVIPMRGIRTSVTNFLNGKGIAGIKTSAFYDNLMGNLDRVTLDVWMAYALGIDQSDFNKKATHAEATRRVVSVASILGIKPAEAQAAVWTGYRNYVGHSDSNFDIVHEYLTAKSNNWVIEGINE
jgi:hypothetical protein